MFLVTISSQTGDEELKWIWTTIQVYSKEELEELKIKISESENKKIIMIRNTSEF